MPSIDQKPTNRITIKTMKGYKTYAVSVLLILHALGSYALGQSPQINITEVLGGLGLAALRSAVNSGPKGVQSLLAALTLGFVFTAPVKAETNAVKLTAPQATPGRVYADTFLSLRTPDFSDGDYLYGVGVGYQITKHWAIDARASHHGLDVNGSAVQDIGGRLVARMPFAFLAPYTFLGASFDLERDAWHLQPGAGIELGVNKRLKGLSVFAEGGLDADLNGHSGYLFSSGLRLRF